ncbi:FAD-binding and (Fe-S)-binding domain-containing protein [Marinomonas algicola]|uniref:FAD-binding and (Fe-S)-binding domain-containing protein n=1 Tax=Marinomonas algicola TaxID=2773454 RepID=UPI00174CD880|nr:FAD-binding and (Fe-S)-binding domain-containing protein [Marinomonas algicola]
MNFQQFFNDLSSLIPSDRIIQDSLRTLAYGTDASFYRLIPKAVIQVNSEEDIVDVLKKSQKHKIPVTFRAAGTSLSGQAITEFILITLGDGWNGHTILDDGLKIALQPGVRGAQANKYLSPYGRKIGPDPASINAAKIGGIAANNASGMCCGTAQNTYYTMDSMTLILADGTKVDTADPTSVTAFKKQKSDLLNALTDLSNTVKADSELAEKIRHKYRLKNTTGYAINALIDYQDPIDILQHLMIGSEGTLGFISEIRYNTVIDSPFKASSLMFFDSVDLACKAVGVLKQCPIEAVELMDWPALSAVRHHETMSPLMPSLTKGSAALLVETRANTDAELNQQIQDISETLANQSINTSLNAPFEKDPAITSQYWSIRKGIFPAVGAVRTTGSTVLIEDVAYPVERLAEAVKDLHQLFEKWHYHNAVIFGHALEGNLHFVFPQSFDSVEEQQRYEGLMEEVTELTVTRYQGSLKAEHGTGRNMAPFVEKEWGPKAYKVMQQLKAIIDPNDLLNPGVILNNDPKAHLKNIKPLPASNPLIDACIECGFCEPSCPSRDLTLTPRQRIVVQREISRLKHDKDDEQRLNTLSKDYQFYGDDTCAGCGLCSTLCPVDINTGDLTRFLRKENNNKGERKAIWIAEHFSTTTKGVKLGLTIANAGRYIFGNTLMRTLTKTTNALTRGMVGEWRPNLPKSNAWAEPSTLFPQSNNALKKVVYFPSCAARTMGIDPDQEDQRPLTELIYELLHKAGFDIILPDNLSDLCCGMPFQSKGFLEVAQDKRNELITSIKKASNNGSYPVLFDTSPCVARTLEQGPVSLQCYDPIEFALKYLLPNLNITPTEELISLHITCSTTKSGLADKMILLANTLSKNVFIPDDIACCGFAGDKGFFTPELNASALRTLKSQLPKNTKLGISSSRTCEIGLSEHSGIPYQSIYYLLDKVSQKKQIK